MNAPVAEGDVLAGKYRVERVLGRGGMGVVVAAMHTQLNQRVAIKLLLPGATADVTERFLREARAAVRLKSEHVARVIDVGELPTGAPYMVMEYLEGHDLQQRVRSGGALPVPEAVEYLLHACEAIAEAHAQGIVHRDLKPANLFVTSAADGSGTVKVLDFGISKISAGNDEDEGMALTKTSTVLGSPLYMSPEQIQSARRADVRSDIWSLGAVLYEMLAGTVPFNAATFSDLVLMVNMREPPALSSVRPDVPPELEAALLRCLEKKPENRFQNVADLAWALVPFGPPYAQVSAERAARTLQAAGISSGGPQSLRSAATGPLVAGSLTAMSASSAVTPAPSGRGKVIALVAAVLALGGVAAFFTLGRTRAADPPRPTPADVVSVAAPAATTVPPPTPAPAPPPDVAPASAAAPPPEPAASASATVAAAPRSPGHPKQAAPPPPAEPTAKKNPLQIQLK